MSLLEILLLIVSIYGLSVIILCVMLILGLQDSLEKDLFKGEAEVKAVYLGSLWAILFAPFSLIKYFIKRMIRLFTW